MSGDYTKFSFKPTRGFSGVHKQQGRVSLDSDFNEFEEILDRRDRAEMLDTLGEPAGVAVVPLTAVGGFGIGMDSGGHPTIGNGRAYVDGILVECFGDLSPEASTVYDARLGEVRGQGALAFDKQPFYYKRVKNPYRQVTSSANAIDLLYLDVWQREVTVFEDEALREVALNGPDTATRIQTAWQVKVMSGADEGSCSEPPPAWDELVKPSTGRLSTHTAALVATPGPCIINPQGGYSGRENRLYRVEIHKASPNAQFKWSRDNASLIAKVSDVKKGASADQWLITVASTGRDAWKRFEEGDHLELLDDDIEFSLRDVGEGLPLVTVEKVSYSTGVIQVRGDLSDFALNAARYPRVRRWDKKEAAEPLLRDVEFCVRIEIEDGIFISFDGSATDTLHAGDYWVFAARTADGSVEVLENAPPRGILHHYARLALVQKGQVISDCRHFWPPVFGTQTVVAESCCTRVVKPGESIQLAIDSLPDQGGCVCLKAGTHKISDAIYIERPHIELHGEGNAAVVELVSGDGLALFISANAVRVHDVRFVLSTPGSDVLVGAIRITNSADVEIERCEVSPNANLTDGKGYIAFCVLVDNSKDVCLANNLLKSCMTGVLVSNASGRFDALGNTIAGMTLSDGNVSIGRFGIELRTSETLVVCTVKHNQISNFFTAIYLGQRAVNAVVQSNQLSALLVAGLVPSMKTAFADMTNMASSNTASSDPAAALSNLSALPFQIKVLGSDSQILLNRIDMHGEVGGGILLQGRRALVAQNTVRGSTKYPSISGLFLGVYCVNDGSASGADGATVSDNNLQQLLSGITVDRVDGVAVKGNRIEDTAAAILATQSNGIEVAGNLIIRSILGLTLYEADNSRSIDNEIEQVVSLGIASLGGLDPELHGNRLQACAIGIFCIQWTGALVISHNRLKLCGTVIGSGTTPLSQGIAIGAYRSNIGTKTSASSLTVESCEITDRPAATAASNTWTAIFAVAQHCRILNNNVIPSDALSVGKDVAKALLLFNIEVSAGSALVNGNSFSGFGPASLVDIGFFGAAWKPEMKPGYDRVTFSNNQCNHFVEVADWGRQPFEYPVRLWGRDVIAMGNHVSSSSKYLSMELRYRGRATMLGNVTSNGYAVNTVNLKPQAYADFNF